MDVSLDTMGTRARISRCFGYLAIVGSVFACQAEFDKPLTEERFQGAGSDPTNEGTGGTTLGSVGGASGAAGSPSAGGAEPASGGVSTTGGSGGATGGGSGDSGGNAAAGNASAAGGTGAPGGGPVGGGDQQAVVDLSDGTLHLLPLGDSITLGVQGGYRNDLYNALTQAGYKVDMVGSQYDTSTEIADKDHEGHPGFTIANMRAEIDGYLAAIPTPDVVIIMLGTNDEAWWTTKKPAETTQEMVDFVDHLRKKLPDAVLIVSTIPPQSSMNVEPVNMDRAEMTKQYNAGIKAALASHADAGKKVFVADANAVLTLADLYDGIHPSREAHRRIAGVFEEVLKELLPPPPK